MSLPKLVCLKAEKLRALGFQDLMAFNASPDNESLCRRGRVTIKRGSSTYTYTYRASPWANPYPVGITRGKVPLKESLRLYELHLDAKLRDSETLAAFKALANKKRIGCYCLPGEPCHGDIVLDRLRRHTATTTTAAATNATSTETVRTKPATLATFSATAVDIPAAQRRGSNDNDDDND